MIQCCKYLIEQTTLSANKVELEKTLEWISKYFSDKSFKKQMFGHNNVHSLLITGKDTKNIDVLFHGHVDVVQGEPSQFKASTRENRIYGRGSLDMKGSLSVLMLLAKRYLPTTKHALLITTDEEVGGKNGTGYLISTGRIKCNYFITGEPTGLKVVEEEKGVIWATIKVAGKATHASTPWLGENPLYEVSSIIDKINKLYPSPKSEKWATTVSPTIIESSNGQNQVADSALIKIDCRYIPEDKPKDILKKLVALGGKLEVQLIEAPLAPLPHPYTHALRKLTNRQKFKAHFASDARFCYPAGIPAILFGPSGKGMHGRSEWVSISSLLRYYDVLEQFIKATKSYAPM